MRRPSQVAKLTVQPKGFFSLCIVELLGRFAFYMLLGVLVLYISDAKGGGLALSTDDANSIYGGYLALVFFTPVFGGVLAQKWLGLRPALNDSVKMVSQSTVCSLLSVYSRQRCVCSAAFCTRSQGNCIPGRVGRA
jgi:hypothetical protein